MNLVAGSVEKARPENPVENRGLTPLELEVIGLFVRLAQLAGLPKSVGEIYGLLYASPRPLAMDDLMVRLNLSKGSTSQGLKQLRAFGAIRNVYVAGERRDHYVAEIHLRNLVSGFLREQLQPHLASGSERLERISRLGERLPPAERKLIQERIAKLRSWHSQGQKIIPVILKLLRT